MGEAADALQYQTAPAKALPPPKMQAQHEVARGGRERASSQRHSKVPIIPSHEPLEERR
jgi:hypothetical protein